MTLRIPWMMTEERSLLVSSPFAKLQDWLWTRHQ
jgi:hypothetical protein